MSGYSIVFCLLAAALGRYQSIVERMPFGEPPPNFNPAALPGKSGAGAGENGAMTEEERTEEEKKLAATIRVSVMNVTPDGEAIVGFTDSSAQPAENYYMRVGQERNGWKVESVDLAERSATISKGGVEVTLKLGEGTSGGKGAAKGAAPRAAAGRSLAAPVAAGGGAMSLLRSRRAREQARAEEERKRREEADAAAQREREEKAVLEAEAAERAKREKEEADKDRAAMREQLQKIADSIKRQSEENQRKSDSAASAEEASE